MEDKEHLQTLIKIQLLLLEKYEIKLNQYSGMNALVSCLKDYVRFSNN